MSFVVPVCKVTAPPATVDGVAVPVIVSIFVSKAVIGPLKLPWLRARFVAPATKVMIVPLTVTVSLAAKFVPIEFVAAAPESSVGPVIGAAALLFCAEPVVLASANGVSGGAGERRAAWGALRSCRPAPVLLPAVGSIGMPSR